MGRQVKEAEVCIEVSVWCRTLFFVPTGGWFIVHAACVIGKKGAQFRF